MKKLGFFEIIAILVVISACMCGTFVVVALTLNGTI